jgi:hypothetical protein
VSDNMAEAEALVRALAAAEPSSDYACVFCGAADPVDKPTVHDDACLHARAARWVERRWMRDEGWRLDALRRLDEVQQRLWRGAAASKDDVEQALTGLESRIEEWQ